MQHPDHFTLDHLRYAVEHISTPGATTPAQIGSWLTALRMSGMDRKPENIASYAEIARNKALPIHLPHRESEWVLDIVGTGGDGHDTFNVSTAASFVVAGAGARVCKVRPVRTLRDVLCERIKQLRPSYNYTSTAAKPPPPNLAPQTS